MQNTQEKVNKFITKLLKTAILGSLNIFTLIPSIQAQTIIQPEQIDCSNINSDTLVTTSEGMRDAPFYCQGLSESNSVTNNSQQPTVIQAKPQPPWGIPYMLNGNICRDRGADTVCLTPQEASSLRWPKPPK